MKFSHFCDFLLTGRGKKELIPIACDGVLLNRAGVRAFRFAGVRLPPDWSGVPRESSIFSLEKMTIAVSGLSLRPEVEQDARNDLKP